MKDCIVSASTMRVFCAKCGIRPYRSIYEYFKANPARQETVQQGLRALKPQPESWFC
jgi:hypothetical protein